MFEVGCYGFIYILKWKEKWKNALFLKLWSIVIFNIEGSLSKDIYYVYKKEI